MSKKFIENDYFLREKKGNSSPKYGSRLRGLSAICLIQLIEEV